MQYVTKHDTLIFLLHLSYVKSHHIKSFIKLDIVYYTLLYTITGINKSKPEFEYETDKNGRKLNISTLQNHIQKT